MKWHVPHFEKMLYDQAQLAALYAEAYLVNPDPSLAEVVRNIFTYTDTYLSDPSGGFYRFQSHHHFSFPTRLFFHLFFCFLLPVRKMQIRCRKPTPLRRGRGPFACGPLSKSIQCYHA